jgi:YhcH/YjgK/YiaL family protein
MTMIKDKIKNHHIYRCLGSKFDQAFDYILKTDLSQIPIGKHEIDGEDVFAIVMEYETKDKNESKFEGHHQHIDLQYIVSGSEFMGIATLTDQTPVETSIENDYDFYDIDSDFIQLDAGMFTIFFPDDLHKPGIRPNQISKIKKVVIKIKI